MAKSQAEQQKAPAPAASMAKRTSGHVMVACKIPTGMELQLQRKTVWTEETPSGSRDRVRYDKFGETVTVRGPAYPVGTTPRGFPSRPRIAGGYALTKVDAAFWDQWLEQNKDAPYVLSGMIFAESRQDDVVAHARELKDLRSGLEPVNPEGDARLPKPVGAGITPITTADENRSNFQPDDADDLVEA